MYRFLFTYLFCANFLNLSAQGFQVNFQGQKQQGMGFAGTALFQDAASIFTMPVLLHFQMKILQMLALHQFLQMSCMSILPQEVLIALKIQ